MNRSLHGFVRPSGEHHAFRALSHLGDGLGVTPESKGFVISDNVNLMDEYPVILNQGAVGDCTANGGAEAMEGALRFYGALPPLYPRPLFSRYYIYAKTRQLMGVPLSQDSGATITDMVRALMQYGACLESEWPSSDPNGWTRAPNPDADLAAYRHRAVRAYALSNVAWIKACLTLRVPVVFGTSIFKSFESIDEGGYMPMPEPNEPAIGAHCLLAIGYRKRPDEKVDFLFLNSWGSDWGMGGMCWMPQEYFDSWLACDAWTIHQAS